MFKKKMSRERSVPVRYQEPPLIINIERKSKSNKNFRQVIHTDGNMQLVLMSLRPLEEIGLEKHPKTTQFIRCEGGRGMVELNGKQFPFKNGDAVIIPAGTWHNITNKSSKHRLSLYTLYSPPHHAPNTIEARKSKH